MYIIPCKKLFNLINLNRSLVTPKKIFVGHPSLRQTVARVPNKANCVVYLLIKGIKGFPPSIQDFFFR